VCNYENSAIATVGESEVVNIWRYKDNQITKSRTYRGHTAVVNSVDFCIGKDFICSGSDDGKCLVFKVGNEEPIKKLVFSEHEGTPDLQVKGCKFAKFSTILYTVHSNPGGATFIVQWLVDNDFQAISNHKIHDAPINSISMTREGLTLILSTVDGWIKCINTRAMKIEA